MVLVLLGFGASITSVHASTYVGYNASNQGSATCGTNCAGNSPSVNDGFGMTVQAPFTGTLASVGFFTGSSVPTSIAILTDGSSIGSTTYACGSAGTCGFINAGQSFTLQDVEALSGLSGSTFFTVNLANPVSVTKNQYVAMVFQRATDLNPILMAVATGGQGSAVLDTCFNLGSTNPTIGNAFLTGGGSCVAAFSVIVGGSFIASGGINTVVTQCYGNCGTPPITLANTNSTHSVNFNQSITLFYEFQSNLNGFLVNVTTSVAKNYNNGIGIVLAAYTIPSCPLGQTPFTVACPGLLQTGINVLGNPNKGQTSFGANNLLIPVSNGQWVAVAITASLSGLDLNDTNTSVPLFQTSGGPIPPSAITQSSLLNAAAKMGLWTWIKGNTITSAPPSLSPNGCQSFAGIDCLFPALVNSFCTSFSQSCQTSSALFWVVILSIFTLFILQFGVARVLPGSRVLQGGEVFLLVFVSFILMFAGLGLLPIWIPVLIFFIVSILMGKNISRYL